jgi:hypothetical protein
MPQPTPAQIRSIFLGDQADLPLTTAAELLGISLTELERDIDEGSIVATTTPAGPGVPRTELIAAAMLLWDQQAIESALGPEAAAVLPPAIRLVSLPLHVPRYQRHVLAAIAARQGMTVDQIAAREFKDVACAHATELTGAVPTLKVGMRWPGRG